MPFGHPGVSGHLGFPGHSGLQPLPHSQLLLRGLAVRLTDGYAAAAPHALRSAAALPAQPQKLDWQCVSYNLVAMDLWDETT